jgi:hypothetical protein
MQMNTTSRPFRRHDLNALLPLLVSGVKAGHFAAQNEIARSFGVDRATSHRWQRAAVERGLITEAEWFFGLCRGRAARILPGASLTQLAA